MQFHGIGVHVVEKTARFCDDFAMTVHYAADNDTLFQDKNWADREDDELASRYKARADIAPINASRRARL